MSTQERVAQPEAVESGLTRHGAESFPEESNPKKSTPILCTFGGCTTVIGELCPGDNLSPSFAGRCRNHSEPAVKKDVEPFLTRVLESPRYFHLDLGQKKLLARRKESAAKSLSYDGTLTAQAHHKSKTSTRYWSKLKGKISEADAERMQIAEVKKPRVHRKPAWLEGSTLQERGKYLADRAIRSLVGNPADIFARWERVIGLYYYRGWTASEVAEELETTEAAIKSIIRQLNR